MQTLERLLVHFMWALWVGLLVPQERPADPGSEARQDIAPGPRVAAGAGDRGDSP